MAGNRIGTRNNDGSIAAFPTATLSGAAYDRDREVMLGMALPAMVALDNTHFVVLDAVPNRNFDREGALAELRASLNKPVSSRRVAGESETVSG